jgi:RES domain-containing protein
VIVYRLTRKRAEYLSGKGAYQVGGRWNSPGVYMLYTAESLALAKCEVARHVNFEDVPDNYVVLAIEIPDDSICDIDNIPEDWKADPPDVVTKAIGDQFVERQNCIALKVPSVCDENSFNYLLNPQYPEYNSKVKIVKEKPFTP